MDSIQVLIICGVVILLVFISPKKIGELARSIGMAKKEFQKGQSENSDEQ